MAGQEADNDEALREILKQPRNCVHSLIETNHAVLDLDNIINIDRYGNMNKLVHVTAYVMRFVKCVKGQVKLSQGKLNPLIASDIEQAETLLIKFTQASSFSKDIEFFSTGNSSLSIPIYVKQFGLFLDGERVLKCKGRLNNASIDVGSKNPILLPSKHRFVELLIRETHNRAKHTGIRDTLSAVRERFWIIRGREATERIVKKCVVCRKACLDFAGPLYVRTDQGNSTDSCSKVYILLFTCASTRAIHLELTQSLSVSSFLRAFRRLRKVLDAEMKVVHVDGTTKSQEEKKAITDEEEEKMWNV